MEKPGARLVEKPCSGALPPHDSETSSGCPAVVPLYGLVTVVRLIGVASAAEGRTISRKRHSEKQ